VFGGNPKEFDDPALDADELWETRWCHITIFGYVPDYVS
jgi:hypothetical protein